MAARETSTGADAPSAGGWAGRAFAAKSLKWSIILAPIAVAAAVSIGLALVLPAATSWPWAILRVAVQLQKSLVVRDLKDVEHQPARVRQRMAADDVHAK